MMVTIMRQEKLREILLPPQSAPVSHRGSWLLGAKPKHTEVPCRTLSEVSGPACCGDGGFFSPCLLLSGSRGWAQTTGAQPAAWRLGCGSLEKCAWVCMCAHVCARACMCLHVCTRVCTCVHVWLCARVRMYVCPILMAETRVLGSRALSALPASLSTSKNPGVDFGDVSERLALRQRLKCRSFQWYLENVYPEMRTYNDTLTYGEVPPPLGGPSGQAGFPRPHAHLPTSSHCSTPAPVFPPMPSPVPVCMSTDTRQ